MSALPTPPTTPTLRATTPGATPPLSSTSSQASTTTATPPQSPASQLTPASTKTSIATNATNATNAPPGTTSTAAATEKSKSPSVFRSIASSIFSTVSSIFTYLGKMEEKFKEKMKSVFGFFYMRKPKTITTEAKEAEMKKLEEARQVAVGEKLEAEQKGDLLNRAIDGERLAAWYLQFINRTTEYLPKYYQDQVKKELEAKKREIELSKKTF